MGLGLGPDSQLLLYALVVSTLVIALVKLRVKPSVSVVITMVVALLMVGVMLFQLERAAWPHQLLRASFIIVPSLIVVTVSRIRWLSRHAWVLLAIGPVAFVTSYICICTIVYGPPHFR